MKMTKSQKDAADLEHYIQEYGEEDGPRVYWTDRHAWVFGLVALISVCGIIGWIALIR